jgi:hypothetical protein
MHLYMSRQPIGGYTGYMVLAPIGMKRPVLQLKPQWHDKPGGDEDD